MTQRILDLDDLIPERPEVRFAGEVYELKSSAEVTLTDLAYLQRIGRRFESLSPDSDDLEDLDTSVRTCMEQIFVDEPPALSILQATKVIEHFLAHITPDDQTGTDSP